MRRDDPSTFVHHFDSAQGLRLLRATPRNDDELGRGGRISEFGDLVI